MGNECPVTPWCEWPAKTYPTFTSYGIDSADERDLTQNSMIAELVVWWLKNTVQCECRTMSVKIGFNYLIRQTDFTDMRKCQVGYIRAFRKYDFSCVIITTWMLTWTVIKGQGNCSYYNSEMTWMQHWTPWLSQKNWWGLLDRRQNIFTATTWCFVSFEPRWVRSTCTARWQRKHKANQLQCFWITFMLSMGWTLSVLDT